MADSYFLDYEGLTTYNEELLSRHIPIISRYSGSSYFNVNTTDYNILEANSILIVDLGYNTSLSAGSSTSLYKYTHLEYDACGNSYPSGTAYLGNVKYGSTGTKRYCLMVRTGQNSWILI